MTRPLPAAIDAGVGRSAIVFSLAAALLLFAAAGSLATPAHAADDSNAGELTPTPTVSSQELNSALSSLAQGTNDTQLQQLISQFQSQMSSGNFNGAASTLIELQNLSNSQSTPDSLKALLQSLSVGSNGASINANTLASILSSSSRPGSSSNEPPQKLSVDLQTLANLMKNVNPTFASELLRNSNFLSQSAFNGPGAQGAGVPVSLPGVSGFSGLSIPSVGAPAVSVGGGGFGVPLLSPATVAVPLLIVFAAAALFLSRNRVARLIGSQDLPELPRLRKFAADDSDLGAPPSDPRKRIEFYFGKAVRLMARRGVPKPESETHREFSSRCDTRPEEPQVKTISSLYEKAKFSGQDVGAPEADGAAAAFYNMGSEKR